MKILVVADEISKQYYDYYRPGMLKDIDLIISCGDLPAAYLEFLVTMASCPLLYVHGNHDEAYINSPPGGCICIEDKIYEYQGIRFLGLGGSCRYRPDGKFMYTEKEMQFRILKLSLPLLAKKGFDVLVTHTAAYGCQDLDTPTHRGFKAFTKLLEKYQPRYMFHGHIHKTYGYSIPTTSTYGKTKIINAFPYRIIDI